MLTLMLDPRFKSLKVVENYVGRGACICLVVEYSGLNFAFFLCWAMGGMLGLMYF